MKTTKPTTNGEMKVTFISDLPHVEDRRNTKHSRRGNNYEVIYNGTWLGYGMSKREAFMLSTGVILALEYYGFKLDVRGRELVS